MTKIKINSPNVAYHDDAIVSSYAYHNASVSYVRENDHRDESVLSVTPTVTKYQFKTNAKVPRIG
jgi:hypothetical protein